MMATLPQNPAPPGLASIFAALGPATPAAVSDTGRFEQLIATLPAAGAVPAGRVAAAIASPTAQAATPVTETPAAEAPIATAPAADAVDAAATASLLLAAASPFVATPAETIAPGAAARVAANDSDSEADKDAPAQAGPEIMIDSAPVAPPVAALPAAVPIALPAATPAADKPAKPAPVAARDSEIEAASALAKTRDTAPSLPQPAVAGAPETKTAKPAADGGASMAVLFAPATPHSTAINSDTAGAAPVTERLLDTRSDDQWIAQLAADIAATKSDKGDISFRLLPRNLGRLDVSMLAGDDGVALKLDTQHEATATIVHAAQPRLVEDLRQQGVRVAGAEVTCTPDQTGRQQQGQSRSAAQGAAHLIETATERAEPRHEERVADRRGRFA